MSDNNQTTLGATAPNQKTTRITAPAGALTRKQRDALFESACTGMTPEHGKRKLSDPVRKWAPQILRKYKQGFSAQQIAKMASAPGINLKLSVRAVGRLIAEQTKQKAAASQ